MKKLTEEQIKLLKKPLPDEAVTKHPTKTYLSNIKAIYVVERLNDVFGIGQWRLKSSIIENSEKMVVVQSNLLIPEYGIDLESYGGNDNSDKGDAYKGATTDALTKICSMLEIGMDVFKGLHGKKKVAESKISTTQISIIEGLLNEVNLTDKQLNAIENEMSSWTEERAYECIEFLKSKQVDRINSGLSYTQTDIKNKLKQM